MMSVQCKTCGSFAINPAQHGRQPGVGPDLCDVCFWRSRAEQALFQAWHADPTNNAHGVDAPKEPRND